MFGVDRAPLTFGRCLQEALENLQTPVLSSPGQRAASGATVFSAVRAQKAALRAMGVRPTDRVAYSLPDSACTALLALTIMSSAAAAPINPRFAQSEIENALRNLRVRSIVVQAGVDSPARRAAMTLGLHTIEFNPVSGSYAGHYELLAPSIRRNDVPGELNSTEHDHALVVQTSGTTGTPKIVALTHRNLLAMMLANCERLGLAPSDRCLGVMPLFHIHGLGAAIVSFLSRSMIHILPEFSVDGFYAALRSFAPTWYTAVPTIHQSVLRGAAGHRNIVEQVASSGQLRFIRSGSAPMPIGVPQELEHLFNTRYVEAAGATECSAYICSNSPTDRRIGSVGRPMPGNDVLILDPCGNPLGPNQEGEIVVRGPGVFSGYEGQPQLNAEAFINGYFRTGDLGHFDADGYFYLTGRLKEQINRAGMKISPREVDDAMVRHPAVQQATAFSVPDPLMGEELHAAIVLKPGASMSELEMQRFLATSLADYKVPRVIHFIPSIPTNATGKIVRVKLAEHLGITGNARPASAPTVLPVTPTQLIVASIFSRILKTTVDDIDFDFRCAGGDSMQAMELSLELERRFARQIPVSAISGNSSVRGLADLIERDGWQPERAPPVVFRTPTHDAPTLFCLPGVGGNVWCYAAVAALLPPQRGVVGLSLPGSDALEPPIADLPQLVGRFVSAIRCFQPHGPYLLTGYSFGGRVAFEICRRLREQGEKVERLILIDTAGPNWPKPLPLVHRAIVHLRRLLMKGPMGWVRAIRSRRAGYHGMTPLEVLDGLLLSNASTQRQQAQLALLAAAATISRSWRPAPLDVPMTVLRAADCVWKDCDHSDQAMGWRAVAGSAISVHRIDGSHGTLFHHPDVNGLARAISAAIDGK